MSNFKIGDIIVCIRKIIPTNYDFDGPLPIVGDKYTITGFGGHSYIPSGYLKEFGKYSYPLNDYFRKIEPKSAIKDLCNSFVEVKETSDCPIKELV